MKALITSFISGLMVVLIGALGLLINSKYILLQNDAPPYSYLSSYVFGENGLILSEMFIALVFSAFAILLLTLKPKKYIRTYSTIAGILRLLILGISISIWKPGWYYILDPTDTHNYTLILLLFSFAQCVSLFFTKKITPKLL